jgi:hypothetical protein
MTDWEQELKSLSPEMKKYISGLQSEILGLEGQVKELESREILHLSLRLAGITGRTSLGGDGPKPLPDHLGIAIYFIFGSPENDKKLLGYERRYEPQEFGLAFGLSPEKYEALMKTGSNEVVIHEVRPENSRLKPGAQFPIEFLTEGEKDGDPQVSEPPVRGDSGPGGNG